jgi:plasmid maintenance system antidote protein VapI
VYEKILLKTDLNLRGITNLQHHYELEVAEQAIGEEVARIQPIAAAV